VSTYVLAIDPGVELGYAIFAVETKILVKCGAIVPSGEKEWGARTDEAMTDLYLDCVLWGGKMIKTCYCEWPAYFDSAGGRMAAVKDSLSKMVFMVGRIAEMCYQHSIDFGFVPVNDWKGQMSKEAVIWRLKNKKLTDCEVELAVKAGTHAWDAVGIGCYALGRF
jgi:hypothetical protein